MNPLMPVPMEEPSWYHLRVLRSLKKVFQSRISELGAEGEDSCEDEELLSEEADRTIGALLLKLICLFASGTRRPVDDES